MSVGDGVDGIQTEPATGLDGETRRRLSEWTSAQKSALVRTLLYLGASGAFLHPWFFVRLRDGVAATAGIETRVVVSFVTWAAVFAIVDAFAWPILDMTAARWSGRVRPGRASCGVVMLAGVLGLTLFCMFGLLALLSALRQAGLKELRPEIGRAHV